MTATGEPAAASAAAANGGARALVPWAIGLCLAGVCVYLPMLGADFVDLDDYPHIVDEPHVIKGVTWEGVRFVLEHRMLSNWHPLTTISQMLDVELFGMEPGAHHLMNVLWHVLNGVVLLFGVYALCGRVPESIAVAALFLLHPLNVESVAWLSQRKTLLSTFFGLLSFGAYARYVSRKSAAAYALSLACFALSLMSKAMLITMPALLLVLDAWPLARFRDFSWPRPEPWHRAYLVLRDKVPFAVLAIGCAVVAYHAQQAGGSLTPLDTFGPLGRVYTVTLGYARYVELMLWPFDLTVLRGNPFMASSGAQPVGLLRVVGAAALIGAMLGVAVWQRRQRPYLLAGVAFYMLSAVPVIGILQLTDHLTADRYAYVTLIGLFVALTFALGDGLRALAPRQRRVTLAIAAPVLVVAMMVRTVDQQRYWQSSVALFGRALVYSPQSASILMQLGRAYKHADDIGQSLWYYARSLRYDPNQEEALRHLATMGQALDAAAPGRERDAALGEYRHRVGAALPVGEGRYRLAMALLARGARREAAHWLAGLRAHDPADPRVRRALDAAGVAPGSAR